MGILKGKVAVVTGSTSGIGLAYARAFADAGANIVLNGMGAPDDVEKERSATENDFGVKALFARGHGQAERNRRAHRARGEVLTAAWMSSLTMPASSTSLLSRSFRSTSGMQSLRSTCPPPSTQSVQPCPA